MSFAVLALSHQEPAKQTFVDGQAARVCGVVEAARGNSPIQCATILVVATETGRVEVSIPAHLRKPLKRIPEQLQGASACFAGTALVRPEGPMVVVSAASDVVVTKEPKEPIAIPAGAGECDPTLALTDPVPIFERRPNYTEPAIRARIEGKVELQAVVNADGTVGRVTVLKSLYPDLDEEAISALRQWRFRPGVKAGKPVPVLVFVEMSFTLKK